MSKHYIFSFVATILLSMPLGAQERSAPQWHSPAPAQGQAPAKDGTRQDLGIYCTPAYTQGTGDGDYINAVTMSGVNNQNTGPGNPAYTDFSLGGNGTMSRYFMGNTYPLALVSGTYAPTGGAMEYYRVWIDYDQDGEFEVAEIVADLSTTSSLGLMQTSVSIPSGVPEGYTGMRVRNVYNVADIDPCATYSFGETEDYLVLIDDGVAPCIPLMDRGTTNASWVAAVYLDSPLFNTPHEFGLPYHAYLEKGAQLTRGYSSSMSITNGQDPTNLGAWADWNQDGDWDDVGEALGYLPVSFNGQGVVYTVNPPATAELGYTVLRVRAMENELVGSACLDTPYGETLDFTISVTENSFPCLPVSGFGTGGGDGFTAAVFSGVAAVPNQQWPYWSISATAHTVLSGSLQWFSMTSSTYVGDRFHAYIDMNDDGEFDATGEDLGYVDNTESNTPMFLSFTIPANCPAGQHIVRLRAYDPVNLPPAVPCGNSGYGMVHDWPVAVQTPGGACIPFAGYWTTDGDYINGMQLGDINQIGTGADAGSAYQDYTLLSTDLMLAANYTITFSGGSYGGDTYFAWIDYNNDGDWEDANEALGSVNIGTPYGTGTLNFTVAAAPLGTKRLRVRCNYGGGLTACSATGFGETEDYSVNLIINTGVHDASVASPTLVAIDGATVELRADASWTGAQYQVLDAAGRAVRFGKVLSTSTPIDLVGAASGAYTVLLDGEAGSQRLRTVIVQDR